MIIPSRPCRGALGAGAMLAAVTLMSGPASAQLFWDWGGGNTVSGSGREVVRFSPQYRQGPDHRQFL